MKDLAYKLGCRMRHFRLAANLSQAALARMACLSKCYVSEVERGRGNISVANLDKIAEALGVSLPVLLDCGDFPERHELMKELAELPDDVLVALHRLLKHAVVDAGPRKASGEGRAPSGTAPARARAK